MNKPLAFAIYLAFILCCAFSASAQMTRLNVGYSAVSADQLPAWVAKDSGIFTKNGLDSAVDFFHRRHDGHSRAGLR